jgi:hypothetical protein
MTFLIPKNKNNLRIQAQTQELKTYIYTSVEEPRPPKPPEVYHFDPKRTGIGTISLLPVPVPVPVIKIASFIL